MRAATHCAVTVICERRRVDLALPAMVPVADLLPALLRIFAPDESSLQWELAPIGRPALSGTDTLETAGILTGEVLLLQSVDERRPAPPASLRDHLEEVVQDLDRALTAPTSTLFLFWLTALLGALLLVPAAGLAGGPGIALQGTVAGVLLVTAIAAARVENSVAAACLSISCGWAGLAGWTASAAAGPVSGIVGAAVAAWLLAMVALLGYPGALMHGAALGVAAGGAGLAGVIVAAGGPPSDVALGTAVVAVLLIGAAPRVVLAAAGLTAAAGTWPPGADAHPPAAEGRSADATGSARFRRADRLLTGSLMGLSLLALVAALPSAVAGDAGNRVFAVGVGAALLLRSRLFSQVPHVLGLRIAGVAVLGGVWFGWYSTAPVLHGLLLLLPVVAAAALAAVAAMTQVAGRVGRARAARVLDLAEQLLVAALVIGASGLMGLFEWIARAMS